MKEGDAAYLKGDYEAARQSFTHAWELAQETPPENPVRYDILRRLTSVRAAAGEFADADTWLQQAVTWRENTFGQKDLKIADDLLITVNLCRARPAESRLRRAARAVRGDPEDAGRAARENAGAAQKVRAAEEEQQALIYSATGAFPR